MNFLQDRLLDYHCGLVSTSRFKPHYDNSHSVREGEGGGGGGGGSQERERERERERGRRGWGRDKGVRGGEKER